MKTVQLNCKMLCLLFNGRSRVGPCFSDAKLPRSRSRLIENLALAVSLDFGVYQRQRSTAHWLFDPIRHSNPCQGRNQLIFSGGGEHFCNLVLCITLKTYVF